MPVIAGGGAQELHHGLPAPGALAVEQAMGIGLGDGIVHQLQAGVAAHEHLLRPAAQDLREQPLGGGQATEFAVVTHVDAVGYVVFRLLHQAENIADQIQLRLTGLAPGHVQIQSPGLQLLVLPGHLGVFRLPLLGGHLGISSHYSASFLLKNLYKSNSVYRFFNKLATPFLLGANTKRAPPKWAGTLFRFPQQPPQPMQLSAQVMVGSQVEMVVP